MRKGFSMKNVLISSLISVFIASGAWAQAGSEAAGSGGASGGASAGASGGASAGAGASAVLVLLPGRRLVELQQEVLRRLARQLRVPPQPVWL